MTHYYWQGMQNGNRRQEIMWEKAQMFPFKMF